MPELAVELRQVTKCFGTFVAVDEISLQIYDNEFFSLLGPSGCGKTTTLRMIGGFEHPTAGEVCILGECVNNVPPYRRASNMVFQHLALFPHMDVYDNVAYGLRMKKLPKAVIKERVRDALDLVELPNLESRRIQQLSGGQQQRVAIARALINEPPVLLLDEPLGALDLKLRLQMQVELKALQNRVGATFIYVTHDQSEALTMSDRLAVMREGRIEQVDTGRVVYERPRTRFVAGFIGDSNLLGGTVIGVNSDTVMIDCKGIRVAAIPAHALRKGHAVAVSVRPERIRFGPHVESCETQVEVVVNSVVYKGSVSECRVELPSGDTVAAEVNSWECGPLRPGDRTRIGFPKEACVPVLDK